MTIIIKEHETNERLLNLRTKYILIITVRRTTEVLLSVKAEPKSC